MVACALACAPCGSLMQVMLSITFLDPAFEPFFSRPPYSLTETQCAALYSLSLLCYAGLSCVVGPIARWLGELRTLSVGYVSRGPNALQIPFTLSSACALLCVALLVLHCSMRLLVWACLCALACARSPHYDSVCAAVRACVRAAGVCYNTGT